MVFAIVIHVLCSTEFISCLKHFGKFWLQLIQLHLAEVVLLNYIWYL